jgi:transposase
LELFNEVEKEANPHLPEPNLESITYQRRRKKHGHREIMLENLPVETIEYRNCRWGLFYAYEANVRV